MKKQELEERVAKLTEQLQSLIAIHLEHYDKKDTAWFIDSEVRFIIREPKKMGIEHRKTTNAT